MPLFVLVTVDGHEHTVVPKGADQWSVSSVSAPGTWHTVRRWGVLRDHYACDCRDRFGAVRPAKNRITPCRHAKAVATARAAEAAA